MRQKGSMMLDLALRMEALLLPPQEDTPLDEDEDEDELDELESAEEDLGLDGLVPLATCSGSGGEAEATGTGEPFTSVLMMSSMWSL